MYEDLPDFSSLIDFARKYQFAEITHRRVKKDGVWCVKENTYLVEGDDTPNRMYFFASTVDYIRNGKYTLYRSRGGSFSSWYAVLGSSVRDAIDGINMVVLADNPATLGDNIGAFGWVVAAEYDL